MTDCYTAALRILGYRFNSEAELRRKLRAKKYEDAEIASTIERLRDEKWLDDARFASLFVRAKMSKRHGRGRIRGELIAAGISNAIADQALRENADEDREREDLAALCAKRIRLMKRRYGEDVLESPHERKKLAAYLLKQGYDAGDVVAEIQKLKIEN